MDLAGDPLLPLVNAKTKRLAALMLGTEEENAVRLALRVAEERNQELRPADVARALHITWDRAARLIKKLSTKAEQNRQ
jgi:hypothetical protein